jgi:hypothetical protein
MVRIGGYVIPVSSVTMGMGVPGFAMNVGMVMVRHDRQVRGLLAR